MVLVEIGEVLDILRRKGWDLNKEMEKNRWKKLIDIVKRIEEEIRGKKNLGLSIMDKIEDIEDVVVIKEVWRKKRKIKLVKIIEKRRIEGKLRKMLMRRLIMRILKVEEDRKMVMENERGIRKRVLKSKRKIGIDIKSKIVIVEKMELKGVIDIVRKIEKRRIKDIERDKKDRRILREVEVGRKI